MWKIVVINPVKRPNGRVFGTKSTYVPPETSDADALACAQTQLGMGMVYDPIMRCKRREKIADPAAMRAIAEGRYLIMVE